jgi:hypothetical protein
MPPVSLLLIYDDYSLLLLCRYYVQLFRVPSFYTLVVGTPPIGTLAGYTVGTPPKTNPVQAYILFSSLHIT